MARMYEMNLIIRLQDRASARMRRISGDMSALARHAQAQNKLAQMQASSQREQVKQGKALAALAERQLIGSTAYNSNLSKRRSLEASLQASGDRLNKQGITRWQRMIYFSSAVTAEQKASLGLTGRQINALKGYEAALLRLEGHHAKINQEEATLVGEINAATAAQERYNTSIAATAPLIARSEVEATRLRKGKAAAHAGSLSFMGGAVAVGLSALAASSYAKFDVQAAKAATQVGSTNFSGSPVGITAATKQAAAATKELEVAILNMAKRYPATAESMAAASYNIFSSMDLGNTAARRMANGITILEEANRAAVGGQVDLAVATDTLITVFNDFLPKTNNIQKNVNAVHTQMAQLFSIVRFMRGGFEELSAGMNKLAPAAKQAQQTLLETGAAFAVVTQAIPSAAQSSTALARLMDLFGSKDFIAGMERAGESVTMLGKNGETKLIPLYDILQKIVNLDPSLQLGGPKLTNFVKEITQFGSATGKGGSKGLIQMQRALTILITQHIKHRSILRQATQDVSEYDKSVTLLSQTADVKWKTAVNNLRVEWIRFGEAAMPVLLKVLDIFQTGLNWFNKLGSGTRDILGKLIVGFGLLAVAAGLFGSAFGGVMMVVATRRLWAVQKALDAIAIANGEVTATSGPARAGILGMGRAALRAAGWVGAAILAFEELKSAAEIGTGTKGNPAQKFMRWWVTQTKIPMNLLGKVVPGGERVNQWYDSLFKKFPALFGTVVKKTKKDIKELTAAEKELADLGITKGQKSKLDLIIKTNAASAASDKKLAAYQKSLTKATIKARQEALKQQKTDIENAAKNLLSKYRELETANKAAMGSLLSGPISGGPILGAYKQVNDMLLSLGVKPIKVPLQFIMQDVQKQVENFDLWRGGLDKIKAKLPKGLSKEIKTGFMDSLKAGGIEKLPEILSLADADPTMLKKYIGYWKQMKKAVDDATKTDFSEQLALWQSYGKDTAWKIAQGMVDSGAEAALLDTFTKTITTTFAGQLTSSMDDAVAQAVSDWKETTPKPKVTAPASAKDTAWGIGILNRAAARANIADYTASAGGKAVGLRGAAMAQYYRSLPTAGQQSAAPGFDTNASYTFDKDVPPNAKIKTALGKSWWWNGWRWIPIRHYIKQTKSTVPPNYPGHAKGGIIGGRGTGDTVPAMLTPGEVVLNKRQIANASRMLGTANHPQAVFNKVQHFADGGVAFNAKDISVARAWKEPKKKKHHGFTDYLTGGGKLQRAAKWTFGKKGLYGAGKEFAQTFTNEGLKAQAAGMYTSFRHPGRRVMSGGMMVYPGGKPKLTARQRIDAENAFLDAKIAGINAKSDAAMSGAVRPHPKSKVAKKGDVAVPDPGELSTTDISAARLELNARKARLAAEKSRLGMAGTPAERAELAAQYRRFQKSTGIDLSKPLTDADLAGLQERINMMSKSGPANEMPDHVLSQASRIRSEKKADAARLAQRQYDRATDIAKARTVLATSLDEASLQTQELTALVHQFKMDLAVFDSSGGSAAGKAYLQRSFHTKSIAILNKLYKRRASTSPRDKSTGSLHRAKTNLDRLEGRLSIEPKIGRMPGGSKPPAANITDAQIKAAKRLHGGHGEALRAIDRGEYRGWQGRMPSFSSMRGREPFNFSPDTGLTPGGFKRKSKQLPAQDLFSEIGRVEAQKILDKLKNTPSPDKLKKRKYAQGGWVTGSGNNDSVRALLTPGEFVLSKDMIRGLVTSAKGTQQNEPTTVINNTHNYNGVDEQSIATALKQQEFRLRHKGK